METWEVRLPDGRIVRKELPAGMTDADVRAAFADAMRSEHIDTGKQDVQRPSNEDYWRERLGNQGEIQNSANTVRSRLGDLATGAAGYLGADERYARHFGNRAEQFADLTPVGDLMGLEEGASQFSQGLANGDVAMAGLGGLSFLASVAGVGGETAGVRRKLSDLLRDESGAIRAWHGSPHDFDRFDMSKIGTGEGAQAYGHGLYFAENKKVADEYRRQLSGNGFQVNGEPLDLMRVEHVASNELFNAGGDVALAKQRMLEQAEQLRAAASTYGGHSAAADRLTNAAVYLHRNPTIAQPVPFEGGRLYEVNINAEPEDFLDWDAPLVNQPRALEALKAIDLSALPEGNRTRVLLERAGTAAEQAHYPATGHHLYGAAADYGERSVKGSQLLREQGFPGIRYLDQGSRGTGQGSRNFVVFNDQLIDILGKY